MTGNNAKTPEKITCFFAKPDSEVFVRDSADGKVRIGGYAAKFNRFSQDLGGFRVKIAPGAFDDVLKSADVRCLVNHDPNILLGRTSSGTFRLFADATGLGWEADPPSTAFAEHYVDLIRRGDMDGCSFSCQIDIDQWDDSGEISVRELIHVSELYDAGPVTFPAFLDTDAVVSHSTSFSRHRAERSEAFARRARHAQALKLRLSLGRSTPKG